MQNPTLLPTAQAVPPSSEEDATLPRSLAFYEAQADGVWPAQHAAEDALAQALHEAMLTPIRYAELMRLIETWLVEDHCSTVDSFFDGFTRTKGVAVQ